MREGRPWAAFCVVFVVGAALMAGVWVGLMVAPASEETVSAVRTAALLMAGTALAVPTVVVPLARRSVRREDQATPEAGVR